MFMGKSGDSAQDVGPKDLMVVLLSDLKSAVTATKPSSYTISSLLGGGGLNRSVEEARMQWALDAERALHDSLTVFFVYFFADLEEYMTSAAVSGGAAAAGGFGTLVKGADTATRRMSAIGSDSSAAANSQSSSDLRFSAEDSRSHFDLKNFLNKRTQMGDSRQLVVFLQDFVQSQLFEKYCSELIAKKQAHAARLAELNRRKSMSASTSSAISTAAGTRGGVRSLPSTLDGGREETEPEVDEDDTFECAVQEWNQRAVPLTITNVKLSVAAVSPSGVAGREMGSNFHNLTVQFTSSATPLAPCELEMDRDSQYYTSHLGASNLSSPDTAFNRYSTVDTALKQ